MDASYGDTDGRSHTGSCVVIGDVGAVHCRSSKQLIVTKSSTEAELVGLSDSTNQSIFIRTFLIAQGYKMKPVIIYLHGASGTRQIGSGAYMPHTNPILLGQRASGHRGSAGGVPAQRGHVRQRADKAAPRIPVPQRERRAHRMGYRQSREMKTSETTRHYLVRYYCLQINSHLFYC